MTNFRRKTEEADTFSVNGEIAVGTAVSEHWAVAPPRRPIARHPRALHDAAHLDTANITFNHATRPNIHVVIQSIRNTTPYTLWHANGGSSEARVRMDAARRILRAHPSPFPHFTEYPRACPRLKQQLLLFINMYYLNLTICVF